MNKNHYAKLGYAPLFKDLSGEKFGKLSVLRLIGKKGKSSLWECICVCGKVVSRTQGSLSYKSEIKSCGCISKAFRHGQANTPTHKSWMAMRARCKSKSSHHGKYYWDRGITICKEWEKFENFLKDMGERPEGHTLDRIDCNGNYSKENCRWADLRTQSINKRNVHKYVVDNCIVTAHEICVKNNFSTTSMYRFLKKGLSIAEAIEKSKLNKSAQNKIEELVFTKKAGA